MYLLVFLLGTFQNGWFIDCRVVQGKTQRRTRNRVLPFTEPTPGARHISVATHHAWAGLESPIRLLLDLVKGSRPLAVLPNDQPRLAKGSTGRGIGAACRSTRTCNVDDAHGSATKGDLTGCQMVAAGRRRQPPSTVTVPHAVGWLIERTRSDVRCLPVTRSTSPGWRTFQPVRRVPLRVPPARDRSTPHASTLRDRNPTMSSSSEAVRTRPPE